MEAFYGSKLEVLMAVDGEEKLVKQTFSDLKEEVTGDDLLAYSAALGKIAPVDHHVDHVIKVVSTMYAN